MVDQNNTTSPPKVPVHKAEGLTKNGNKARIVLFDQEYELRITKAQKLILTK
jgi:hemin uptake protein HemP